MPPFCVHWLLVWVVAGMQHHALLAHPERAPLGSEPGGQMAHPSMSGIQVPPIFWQLVMATSLLTLASAAPSALGKAPSGFVPTPPLPPWPAPPTAELTPPAPIPPVLRP